MTDRPRSDQDAAKCSSLEKTQRTVQMSVGALSTLLLFTMTFPIPATVNCVLVVALVWAMVVLDRRIRVLGGKGGFYI